MKFTKQQHKVWSILFKRQVTNIERFACREFRDGFRELALPPSRIPTLQELNKRIKSATGWKVIRTPVRYLSDKEWSLHMARKEFPITNFIRTMEELDFTPEPDMFHDIFGHLPLLMNSKVARLIESFSSVYVSSEGDRLKKIAQLWWNTIEFGLIQENGQIKAFGAGLMSSFGEIQHACSSKAKTAPFSIRRGIKKPRAVSSFHNEFLVIKSVQALQQDLERFFSQMKREQI